MYPQHERTIQRLTEHFAADLRFDALIIGGSVAKGWALETSDVDFMLVATDEEFARRQLTHDFGILSVDFTDYEGGYVDGKVIDLTFMRDVLDHGSEPARAAFVKTFATFSRNPEIDTLIRTIPVYPEAERDTKITHFYSQLALLHWFIGEAQKRGDTYLMMRFTADLVLFGGRLLLAYNRMLYPYHKWFMRTLETMPEKPDDFMALTHAFLQAPSVQTATAYYETIRDFRDWGVTEKETWFHFVQDREWNWRTQKPPLHDW